MNCFPSFRKRKHKHNKEAESAPALINQSGSDVSANRQAKSVNSASSPRTIPELYKEKEHNLRIFTLDELREATSNFNKLLKIGEGGFGSVYKGTINIKPTDTRADSIFVAIKRLNNQGWQGHKEWLAEVHFLGVVHHPNLVKLLGYCSVDEPKRIQRLLVYEYMPKRSLENHLFSNGVAVLPWKTRLKIMLGAAEGLAYLHEGLEVKVIFRDFKSSNVLLDGNFNAKLSDFGLAREGPTGDLTHVSTAPVGTYGYAAPEYVETGHLNLKSDIYSFGVVLYEILTGRRVIEKKRQAQEQKLLLWVRKFPVDGKMFNVVMDIRLRNHYCISAAIKVAKLAERCVSKSPADRPSMNEIIEVLNEAINESVDEAALTRRSGLKEIL